MSDRIEPALTSKQWAELAQDRERVVMLYGDMIGEDANVCAEIIAYNNAVLPDTDPRKITREDVLILHECCESANSVYPLVLTDAQTKRLAYLTAALDSYLPPE